MTEELVRASNDVKAILVVYDGGDLDSHVANGRGGAIAQYNRICRSLGLADPVTFRLVNRQQYDLVFNLERALPTEQVPDEELALVIQRNEREHDNFVEAYIAHATPGQATVTLAAGPSFETKCSNAITFVRLATAQVGIDWVQAPESDSDPSDNEQDE
eukprot:1027605-Rhodomonas_salina.1